MQNAGLDEAQAGIKIAGRNMNNLTYADDTTLMAESKDAISSVALGAVQLAGAASICSLWSQDPPGPLQS